MKQIVLNGESVQLGDNLRNYRMKQNLSEREVSKMLHVDITTISKYEHNVRTPDIYMMIRFADVYNVTLDRLVGRKRKR